jgi:hypothetical protein
VDCYTPNPSTLSHHQFTVTTEGSHRNVGRHLNSKALICIWTTNNRQEEEHRADQIQKWMDDLGWKHTVGQIWNEQHDGYLEGQSTYLIAASSQIIDRLPTQFDESNDGFHYLEQILDIGDGDIRDCFSYFAAINDDRKPSGSGAKIKTTLQICHSNEIRNIDIFDVNYIGPSLVSRSNSFGTNTFVIEAIDGITSHKVRPIWQHELLTAYGFKKETVQQLTEKDTKWKDNFNRLVETAPTQTWALILAALYAAELECATAETTHLY